jgi:uncharacterized oxidoreductase
MKLEQRTILITGGTSGIGFEFAKQLLQRGNIVIVTGRDGNRLEEAERSLSGLNTIQSDVSDPSAIDKLHSDVLARFPSLDTLINNAGVMRNLKLDQERDLSDITREIDIDLSGPIRMVQRFLPHLKSQKNALVVNVSSGLAFVPMAIAPVYCAAKAGIHSYTLSLREQLAGQVRVVELAPPGVETPLLRGEFAKELSGMKAMDVQILVKKAIAGIESGCDEIVPGQAKLLKLVSRVAPGLGVKMLSKALK